MGSAGSNIFTEEGMFYIVGVLAAIFSAWLVVNYEAGTVVFFGYTALLMLALAFRFMMDSPYIHSLDLFSNNVLWDIGIGLIFSAVWYFIFLPSPYGVLPLPPLPAEVLAVGPAPFLIIVLLAPIAEEYFFRGSLMPMLEEIVGGKRGALIAVALSAVVFAGFHWTVYMQGALSSALIAALLFGLYTGAIALWRKNILSSIIIHMIINFAIISPKFVIIA